MRFGVVATVDKLPLLEKLGYEYIEINANTLGGLSEEEFSQYEQLFSASPLKPEVMSILFPGDFKLYEADKITTEKYLHGVFSRGSKLGVKICVFGSGGARRKRDDFSFNDAFSILVKQTQIIADVAAKYDITIAVEPLNKSETNMINTVTEAAILALVADRKNIGTLADSYHIFHDNEPLENIETVGELVHVHVALLENRSFPTRDDAALTDFFGALHSIGYDGRISIESWSETFDDDAVSSVSVLRKLKNK